MILQFYQTLGHILKKGHIIISIFEQQEGEEEHCLFVNI